MQVTVETNVLYAALRSQRGASHAIMRAILHGDLTIALSVPLFVEYEAVLKRPQSLASFDLSAQQIDEFLDALAAVGKLFQISYRFRPNLRDEADDMLVELAVASQSRYLITSNMRDFTIGNELKFDDLHVLTPRDFWLRWMEKSNE